VELTLAFRSSRPGGHLPCIRVETWGTAGSLLAPRACLRSLSAAVAIPVSRACGGAVLRPCGSLGSAALACAPPATYQTSMAGGTGGTFGAALLDLLTTALLRALDATAALPVGFCTPLFARKTAYDGARAAARRRAATPLNASIPAARCRCACAARVSDAPRCAGALSAKPASWFGHRCGSYSLLPCST